MVTKNYSKQTDAGRLSSEIIASGKSQYPTAGFRFYGVNVTVEEGTYNTELLFADDITNQEISEVDAIVAVSVPIPIPEVHPPVDGDGKPYVRSEARPLGCTTIFTGSGDSFSPAVIGGGSRLIWDASDSSFTTTDAPDGYKQKTIDLMFLDTIYARAGHIFSTDAPLDSYLDMYIMCPPTGWYLKEGQYVQNNTGSYMIVDHNVSKFPLNGCGYNGVNLDSHTASQGMPAYYMIRVVVTTPTSDTISKGCALLMMYRERTVVL